MNNERTPLVEDCQVIDINTLVRRVNAELKLRLLQMELEAMGVTVKLTTTRTKFGERYWIECPSCECRTGNLYKHPTWDLVACRLCLGLDYRKHRYSKMIEAQV